MLGVRDIDLLILSKLGLKSLKEISKVDKRFYKLSNDENLWRKLFQERFGKHEKTEARTWKNFYSEIVYYSSKYGLKNRAMEEASRLGGKNIDIIRYFISQGVDDFNFQLYSASYYNYKDLINFFISKGAKNWNAGLHGAAEGGHRDLVDFFISKGARNWNGGMLRATEGGHKDLVEFFQTKIERRIVI